jgi:hypothetical protein
MRDHEKFKALLDEVGLTRQDFAELMDMKFTSMTNQLAPAKHLPKWAKSVLIFYERWEEKKNNNRDESSLVEGAQRIV